MKTKVHRDRQTGRQAGRQAGWLLPQDQIYRVDFPFIFSATKKLVEPPVMHQSANTKIIPQGPHFYLSLFSLQKCTSLGLLLLK